MIIEIKHEPGCPLGENGLRAYHEARQALSTLPPEARQTDSDLEALCIAEFELEAHQVCNCGADKARAGMDGTEQEFRRQQTEANAQWTEPRFEDEA